MGKIVKFCNSCDEGFAAKFAFCPNCGGALEAFEMNPLQTAAETAPMPAAPAFIEPVEEKVEAAPVPEAPVEIEEPVIEASAAPLEEAPAEIAEEPTIEASTAETEEFTEPEAVKVEEAQRAPVFASTPFFVQTAPVNVDAIPRSFEAEHEKAVAEGSYYLTVMEEKNVKQRNSLLLGTLGVMLFACMFGLAYSIFSRDLEVGAINDDLFNAVLVDEVPMTVEEMIKQNKDKNAGGGGGGGREEEEEVTKGDLADQSKNPTRPPDAKVFRSDNFELKTPPPQTEGNMTFPKQYDRWGDPNGRFTSFSNGTGSGGGQGSGAGTGQGSGRGTGAGSGDGSGYGGGLGTGNGNGTGDGDGGGPPPRAVGVTSGIKILSKPRPGYTDSARQANIQGTVILRVTFMANGSIGGISAVKGLPSGLTEQAIAAARRINFEPAKMNGVPQSVTKQIEYTFSIY